jgi:predicted DNA-binding mobile mystery protein A
MNKRLRTLQLRQLDQSLQQWRDADLSPRPAAGWGRAIRDALGMSATALGRRLGMTGNGVRKLEAAEAQQVITLPSLRKLANALDCELVYAMVPRKPLAVQLQDRALAVAAEQLRSVSHSMALEDQAVKGQSQLDQRELLAQELLDGPRRALW